ncbi:MAG: hypothetical protein K8W52_11345 [Deltaproteobacteria bacterium]|nr:hypothetical protein [Deltaproteobacteria bacterium]
MPLWLGLGLGLAALAARPAAAESVDEPPPSPVVDAPTAADPGPDSAELLGRIDDLEQRLHTAEVSKRARFPVKITGYGDLGFFATGGDGSGLRRDIGHRMFPTRTQYAWVFYGDLLAPMVNSRGDVADLGELPGVDRVDAINADGNPSFLVNELNLTINAGLGERASFTSSVNFTPRSGHDFGLGDSVDLDLAQLEWQTRDGQTSVFVGKVDSVLGIEYRARKAPARFGITPTLIARYTTGTAIGVKARSKLAGGHVILAASVTNGSFGVEQFHFFDEVDTNAFKTLSGRAALRLPIGDGHLELGPSGQWGVQDGARDGAGAMWFVGADAELELERVDVRAQWLTGGAPGDARSMTYGLDLRQGGYLEADVIVTPVIGLLGRAEFRDAEVHEGSERLYITKNWRATGGFRLLLSPNAIVKAEYSHNGEYGGVPAIPDDVVTTSAVLAF